MGAILFARTIIIKERTDNMSLKIVYGKAGCGKSTYIFNEIATKINDNKVNKIYVITPDQFSFTAEKKLLENRNAVLKAEVLTFNRMAYRILNEVGGITKQNLSSSGKAMLIEHILLTHNKDFTFLGKSDENVELISRQLTELKKHQVDLETLKEITESTQDKYLQKKLQDIASLYEIYQQAIQTQYIDENDGLNILAEKLEKSKDFRNCDIYIDEFAGFTLQEYEVLRRLFKISRNVTITICTDNLQENTNPDTDTFYANKQTVKRIIDIANEENIEIEKPIYLKDPNRFKTEELKHLAENMISPFYKKYEKNVDNLSLFLAANPYSEIENVAVQITKLVKQGYRYEQIAVITKNIEQYSSLCKAIFSKYNIPVFIDEKKDLGSNILVRFILSLLEIFAKGWMYEAVFGYIKTGLLDLDSSEIALLENYCIKWGIKGSKWYSKEWNFYNETEEQQNTIIYAKNKVIEPLLELKKQLQGTKTVKEITIKIYEFLIKNEIYKKIEEKIEELKQIKEFEIAKEYEQSIQILTKLFDEIVLTLGDKNITFDKYAKILKMGFSQRDLGIIPATADQVTVGDVDRSRSQKVNIVFIIGLNDGSFPSIQKDEGFLDDKDRNILKEQGIELAKTTTEQIYDDNFNIYKAFTTAEEKLYLSYVSSDSEGKSLRASILINKIKRIFPNIQEKSDVIERKSEILLSKTTFDELLINLRKFIEGEKIEPIWFEIYNYYENNNKMQLQQALKAIQYKNEPNKLDKTQLEKLYGNTLKTSVSRLEQYKSCAFSYYLKYGLKLKEKDSFNVEAIDTGNLMHDVIDSFFERLEELNLNVKKIDDEQIEKITEKIVEEKLSLKKYDIFNTIPKYRVLAQRLKKVVVKSMKYIVDSIKYSEFEVLGHELEFKTGGKYEPIEFSLKDGKKVEITGKIDRVDIAKTTNGKYIRIIDYKSSIKNINLNEVIAGIQLQLLTYLDATCKNEDVMPAGALYFNLIDPVLNGSENMTDDEIKEELRKQFKMQGLILADSQIVRKMDTKLITGNSNIVPAYIGKDGEVSDRANTLKSKQFENLQKYMEKIIKQISEEILEGNINIEPFYRIRDKKTPCEYCSYKSICQFNQITKNNYNYISNKNKEYILEEILKSERN